MDSIVHAAVQEVAKYKPRKKRKRMGTEQQILQGEEYAGEDKTWHGRHKKSLPVTRILVVIAMQYIHDALRPLAVCDEMEHKAVNQVFKKSPGKYTRSEKHQAGKKVVTKIIKGRIKQNSNHGRIDSPYHQWMCFGKHLQILVPEQLRLSLIMYLLKPHKLLRLTTKIGQGLQIVSPYRDRWSNITSA